MTEISMMLLCPWVSYLVAGGLDLSGIVSILTNGVFLGYYATPSISETSKDVIRTGYEVVAYSAETIVFLFLGIGIFSLSHPFQDLSWGLLVTSLFNVNIARALNVLCVSHFINRFRSPSSKLTGKKQFVIWFSGLRGAMAYALAL
jgi:solute carrier family 9 (sodium/hydrogen exchanger), member 8